MATEQISDKSGIHFKLSDLENQCGDNCQGECSGEVTGTPFCPQSEREKVLDELEKRITEEEPVFLFTILGYIKELRRAGEP